MTNVKERERAGKAVFAVAATVCIAAVIAIFSFLIVKSIPAFKKIGALDFVFGKLWSPDREDVFSSETLSGTYGIFTMIVSSLAVTAGALLVGGVLGYFTAVFLAFFCPEKLKKPFAATVNLLAGIPSVVYGFFGVVFLLPKLSFFAPNNGSGLLATSLILGIMILPTVVSLSKTAIEAVPRSYYEGATALGATHTQAVFKTVVPAARSGITASFVLGVGRALGETMAVVMVAGNSPTYPNGLFGSFRVLTANIVMEMGYAGEVQEGALVATGVVLLLFVLFINLIFTAASTRVVKKAVQKRREERNGSSFIQKCRRARMRMQDFFGGLSYRLRSSYIGKGAAIFAGVFTGVSLALVVGFIFMKGLPVLLHNPRLLYGRFEFASNNVTILPSIVATLMAIVLSLSLALPIGIMTAVFLNEYAKKAGLAVRI